MASAYTEFKAMLVGGLNTTNDPSSVEDDGLTEATGMEYQPPNIGLFAVGGRSQYDTASAAGSSIFGLVWSQFDVTSSGDSGNRLVAFSGTSALGMSATGQTGTFYTLKSNLTAATAADGIHYGNDWFFWNGIDSSWRVAGTSMRASGIHGLSPVSTGISVVATTVSGATGTIGTYDVWVTEYYADSTSAGGLYSWTQIPNIESAFAAGLAGSVTLSTTGMKINVTMPQPTNLSGANIGYRTYVTIAGGKYPFGYAAPVGFIGATANAGVALDFVALDANTVGYPVYPVTQPLGGVAVSKNGAPPIPYDMTMFQDSLCAIDNSDRQTLRYSEADAPHAWPSTNYIRFETPEQDKLTALETCNNALLVFSSRYGYRVDDLPRPADGDNIFSMSGRAKEPFSRAHGCIATRGTAVCSIFGSGELCFFVCRDGIHVTDGFKTDYASSNLDWYNTVDLTNLPLATLKNNPKKHRIEFYYANKSANDTWSRLDFYYHPALIRSDEGGFPRFPILGPTPVPGPAAAVGILNNDWQVWTGDQTAAHVWLEGTGVIDNKQLVDSSGTIQKRFRTKDFYFAGLNGEFEIPHIMVTHDAVTASGSGTAYLECGYDEAGVYTATASDNFSLAKIQPLRFSGAYVSGHERMQNVSLRVVKDDGGAWQEHNYVAFIVEGKTRLTSSKSSV